MSKCWIVSHVHLHPYLFLLIAHWNNCQRIDMSLHSDTVSWFQTQPYFFLLLLKDACWVEMRQISVLVFGLTWHGAQTRSKNLLHSWRTHCTTEKAIHANTTKFRSIYISCLLNKFRLLSWQFVYYV